ncbi:MAG: NfeD family protein [Clostridia bacterium]|nr:NfeD family protein [Clostridia bacterium]
MIFIYVWLTVLVACIIIEAITPNLVTIWFIPASFIAFLFAVFHAAPWLQVTAFISSGLILLITTKPFFERLLNSRPAAKTNIDAIIGKRALVIEDIDNVSEKGAVKIEGKVWSARNALSSEIIKVGEIVEIKEIQGVKLMCIKPE